MRRFLALLAIVAAALVAAAAAHELDHPAPPAQSGSAPQQTAAAGPATAKWDFVGSIATGNPHTDIDFFTRGQNTFASVGTLAVGPNGGGQSIVQLTEGNEVKPKYVGMAPTAFCPSSPGSATALQHDVEATPKGGIGVLNTFNPFADRREGQIIVDATDGPGRCHDQGTLGLASAPQGGLEIIDVTDPAKPMTIGMTSHIGQAHTVNIDPKRPHIAYAVTSDTVTVTDGKRQNEVTGSADQNDLDGFEVVDLRSCMNFAPGTSIADKRSRCRPSVFRYRWGSREIADGHTDKQFVFGCHELEIYPDDRLVCGAGPALMLFDMAGAFDDRGTPNDFTDDTPRGRPLPCSTRDSSSAGPLKIMPPHQVVDCVLGGANRTTPLTVPGWLDIGAPSLEGVRHLGSVHHEGGHPGTSTDPVHVYPSPEDLAFNHEAELSHSGNLLIATDERGGGVTPPGASCTQNDANPMGNGGIHFFRADRLRTNGPPATAEEAWQAYARTPDGKKAIYRAPVRTGAQATVCTSHVFQQIPGQNRIFMAWYSQGTQVIDFTENADGTVTFKEAGYFIPADTNAWVSHIFKAQQNPDGTFTYWGATGDFNLGERGRNAIDVYRVTLPAPPLPANGPGVIGRRTAPNARGVEEAVGPRSGAPSCVPTSVLGSSTARPRSRGRSLLVALRSPARAKVELFRQSAGRTITGERRVARYANRRGGFTIGRRFGDGFYVVRITAPLPTGSEEVRRIALRRSGGRWLRAPAYERRETCGLVRTFKLERPVFGGRTNRALNIAFRLESEAQVSAVVRDARGRVRGRFAEKTFRGGITHRLRQTVKSSLPRGRYTITLTARSEGRRVTAVVNGQRV